MTRNKPTRNRCELCEDYPSGFRCARDLQRHHNRAHAANPQMWICADPLAADSSHKTKEGWRPKLSLDGCNQCKTQKTYHTPYNAVLHLRRAHFTPKEKGRSGKSGGIWPPVKWLRKHGWVKKAPLGHDNPAMVGEKESRAMSDMDNRREWSSPGLGTSMNSHQQQYHLFRDSWFQSSISDVSRPDPVPLAESPMTTQLLTEVPTITQNPGVETVLPDGGSETTSDMSGNCHAESGTGTETVLDDDLLLNLAKVGQVARSRGTWFVDLEYQDMRLPKETFAQVLLSNSRLSRLACTAQFTEDGCQVQLRSESVVWHEAELPKVYTELVQQLEVLCLQQDGVKWYAHDSAYTIEGSNERYHLCLTDRCEGCAPKLALSWVDRLWWRW